MISSEEAIKIVLDHTLTPGNEQVALQQSVGRILDEHILADQDFPPFDRVMMDGIAINSKAWEKGRRSFKVEGIQTAGAPQMTLSDNSNCLEVMTGAMLPVNTDAIIRYEDIKVVDGQAEVLVEEITFLQNVHKKGTDRQVGDLLLEKGVLISPAEIAVLATVGKSHVKVLRHLHIAIVSTGDELVNVDEQPLPHQIRRSNIYAIQAALIKDGHQPTLHHIVDEAKPLQDQLEKILDNHDLVILSGGVSKGKKDYVPEVLDNLEVEKMFHGVRQRPGKPFWFGMRYTKKSTAVFALPGNPVSTFMCFYRYILPWIHASYGLPIYQESAVLAQDFEFAPELTYYLQVSLKMEEGTVYATPKTGGGSGDLANLVLAEAFMELPADSKAFKKGQIFPVFRYR